MRSFRQSGVGQLVVGGIVVTIILGFVVSVRTPSLDSIKEDCAVEVGSHCVEPKEYFAAYGLVASIGLNERAAKQLGLRELVARGLAERELLLEEGRRLGLDTGEDAVDAELLEGRTRVSLPAEGAERLAQSLALCVGQPGGPCEPGTIGLRALPVKKNGEFDMESYKRMVRIATGRSTNQFKEMQARELGAARVRELLTAGIRVSEEEAYLNYSRVRSTATARVVTVKNSWFERFITPPTAADIASWKASHEPEFKAALEQAKTNWKPGCPVVEEIAFETAGDESQAALLERAKGLTARLDSKGFELLARRSSVAPSARLGGRVGCVDQSYGSGSDEILATVQALDKPGTISAPFTSPRGANVVRLVAWVTAENVESLASDFVAYELTSAYLGGEAARKFGEELVGQLKPTSDASALTDELLQAALARGPLGAKDNPGLAHAERPQSDISRAFTLEQSPLPSAMGSESPAQLVFDLTEPGQVVARPIPVAGGYAVLQLKEKDLATREKFVGDRELVMSQLRARKAEEALAKYVAALVEKAGGIQLNPTHVPPEKDQAGAGKKPG